MTGFQVDFDASEALRELRRLIQKCEDPRDALDAVGFEFSQLVDQTFEAQADPWNRAWKPLSPLTLRLRRKRGRVAKLFSGANLVTDDAGSVVGQVGEILRDTGRLSESITHDFEGDTLVVGTNVEYARHHQLGRKVPYRPFLPVRQDGSPDLPDAWTRSGIEIVENILRQQGAFD